MTITCENEIMEHNRQKNNLKEIYDKKTTRLDSELELCNNQKSDLVRINNDLSLKNSKLQSDFDENDTLREQQCAETLRKKEIEHEEFKQSINSMSGGFRTYLNEFEDKISGGIIGQIKQNLKKNYASEIKNFNKFYKGDFKGGGKQKGGNPILFMAVAVVKIALMTLGTFFFDWWPVMMIISFYCVYIEYKMIKLSGQSVMGLPIVYLLGAYLCPCFWAIGRVAMGWTTNMGTSPNLFNIFSKCTDDGFTLNFHEYYGRDCKDNKCVWTTNDCYGTLFDKNNSIMGSLGLGDMNLNNMPGMSSMPGINIPNMSNMRM